MCCIIQEKNAVKPCIYITEMYVFPQFTYFSSSYFNFHTIWMDFFRKNMCHFIWICKVLHFFASGQIFFSTVGYSNKLVAILQALL